MTPETIRAVAEQLASSYRSGEAGPPVRDVLGAGCIEAAYAAQTAFIDAAFDDDVVVGRKIGLTAPAVQAQLGVEQPDFGVLFASMEVANGARVRADRYIAPRVEGEIAFRLRRDLDGDDQTLDDVRAAIEAVAPAIEICDSRIAGWDIAILDTVADNASAVGFVLGDWRSLDAFTPRDAAMTMTVADLDPVGGRGEACLGDPLAAVLWLARTAMAFGDPLRAGQIVLSGALAPMLPFERGSRVDVTINGLGSVSVTRAGSTLEGSSR